MNNVQAKKTVYINLNLFQKKIAFDLYFIFLIEATYMYWYPARHSLIQTFDKILKLMILYKEIADDTYIYPVMNWSALFCVHEQNKNCLNQSELGSC